jgi:hypothetical protein
MATYYGTSTNTFDGLRDSVKTHLDTLISAMKTGFTPTINYAYNYHSYVPIILNGVSIGIDSVDNAQEYGLSGGSLHYYEIRLSLRVHVGYVGDVVDQQTVMQLIQSLDNYFNTHKELNSSPRYILTGTLSISPNLVFNESYTIGGEIIFAVKISVTHDQV